MPASARRLAGSLASYLPHLFSPRAAVAAQRPLQFSRLRWQSGEAASASASASAPPPGGEAAAAPAPDAAVAALVEDVAKLKAQLVELNSSRLRVLAEMENVRTIAKRDVAQSKDYALQGFAKSLLNVVDNLHRAVEAVPADAREKRVGNENLANLFEGVAATERDFLKILGQNGISPFGVAGEPFDYNKHEVMLQVPAAPGTPVNTVTQVFKQGYTLKDRTLRVAQVAIAVAEASA